MTDFVELTQEQYDALQPIQKAQYKRNLNKHLGIKSENKRIPLKAYKDAIRDKCMDCCCDQREEVRLCQITACSLWSLRPYKSVDNAADVEDNTKEDGDEG